MDTPKIYLELWDNCIGSLERPDFHPERYLNVHIDIVTRNAIKTGNQNLVMAAKIHDLFKPVSGSMKKDTNGEFYWSNPEHATQAADWILEQDDIKHWCWTNGADWRTVEGIVRYHMVAKNFAGMSHNGLMRYSRLCGQYWSQLILFTQCDDMIGGRFK